MYEELTEKLRCCVEQIRCGDCRYVKDCDGDRMLMSEAADAIEELIKGQKHLAEQVAKWQAEVVKGDCEAWLSEHDKPRWIPVTEKLPEKAYGCLAIVWDNNPYTGDVFLNYYPEFVGYDSGTWNDCDGEAIPLDVVYWMKMPKIPEPPKEEH